MQRNRFTIIFCDLCRSDALVKDIAHFLNSFLFQQVYTDNKNKLPTRIDSTSATDFFPIISIASKITLRRSGQCEYLLNRNCGPINKK